MGGQGPAGRPRRNFSPADVSFRPGISVSPKRNGGASKSTPVSALSAQPSGPTHARVFGGISAKQGHYLHHRSASSSIIPFRRLLPRCWLCWLCRLHLPSGSLLLLPIEYSCAFAAATLIKMGAALDDWLLIRFHRRQQEALYPSSLSTSYPLGPGVLVVFALWNSICRLRPQLWPLSRISTAALRAGLPGRHSDRRPGMASDRLRHRLDSLLGYRFWHHLRHTASALGTTLCVATAVASTIAEHAARRAWDGHRTECV